jgi:hypothetical protein
LENPRSVATNAQLGDTWAVSEEIKASFDTFTNVMHARHPFTSVNDLRYQLFKERCGNAPLNANLNVEMASMPSCKETLQEHIKRATNQAANLKRAL